MIIRNAILATILGMVALSCDEDPPPPPPAPTVALVQSIRGELTLSREGHEQPASEPTRVEDGAAVTTSNESRASMWLDTGSWLLADRQTEVVLTMGQAELKRGRLWIDASYGQEVTIRSPGGTLRAQGATLAVSAGEAGTEVYCGSGEVTYVTEQGDGRLEQGEEISLGAEEPVVRPAEMWDDWTGGLVDPASRFVDHTGYVGRLSGRTLEELGVARTAIPVRAHDVRTTIRGDFATTQVTQTFFNVRSDTLEAEYVVRLPDGAIVENWAVDLGSGVLTPGNVGTIGMADRYRVQWGAPGNAQQMLSYDGPNRLRARLYPIAPGQTVRVQISYSQWLERRNGMRTYIYPMHAESEPPLIGEFSLEVDPGGTNVAGFRAGMGAQIQSSRVVLRQSDFRPHADFYLDMIDRQAPPTDRARAYVVGAPEQERDSQDADRYTMIDIPTEELVELPDESPPLSLVILVDISGGTEPEDLELCRSVVEGILRQLPETDRVTLRLADITAHVPAGISEEPTAATDETRTRILDALARVQLGGATNLGESLRGAAEVVAGQPRGAVLYLGDALPTTGALDVTSLRDVLSGIEGAPRFFGLAVGDGGNLDLLRALFEDRAAAIYERTTGARVVMEFLAEAARPTLRDVRVDLGPTLERVYPRTPLAVAVGQRLRMVGRLVGDAPKEVRITGRLDNTEFTRTFPIDVEGATPDGGDIRRRWATARLGELLDEDAGREALAELGVRFGLITPWTPSVVGVSLGTPVTPIPWFHRDPSDIPWGLGGRGSSLVLEALGQQSGWRRRIDGEEVAVTLQPESTWTSRVDATTSSGPVPVRESGDGGLAEAAITTALRTHDRGPRGCYERKLLVRPDLSGSITLEVAVDGSGQVTSTSTILSTLGDRDVESCVLTEIQGIRFPATESNRVVTVRHSFHFATASRPIGVRTRCSDASGQSLAIRERLWRERLSANAGPGGALTVWREARDQCELRTWRDQRTLLAQMLEHVGSLEGQIQLYEGFPPNSPVAGFLRRAILRAAYTPEQLALVRARLGLELPLDWEVFARAWRRDSSPEARLRLVRRWLAVVPEDLDLRLRLLSLLEQTNRLAEARRVARELRADPLADARVRTAVGEFWLRQDQPDEARRVFSELVELTPLDAWARRRLGDLYRAHGWPEDAYREYTTLARLRPSDESVWLLLARAAADAGRIDEAIRLEQRLSESASVDADDSVASTARLWTTVRLARLAAHPQCDPSLATECIVDDLTEAIRHRRREAGVLREPPAIFAALTWPHPDDTPQLWIRSPDVPDDVGFESADLGDSRFGIHAARIRERENGDYLIEIRRSERDQIRDTVGELLIITGLGTAEERILRRPVQLSQSTRTESLTLTPSDELQARN